MPCFSILPLYAIITGYFEVLMKIDLHSHTLCSDGVLSPADLVARAVERDVNALAITDHDTEIGRASCRERV